MKAVNKLTGELFASRRRQITDTDTRRFLGELLADPRITANATMMAVAILININPQGVAILTDQELRAITGGKPVGKQAVIIGGKLSSNDSVLEASRTRLRRRGWLVCAETINAAGERAHMYAFPKLGRAEGRACND
jgi:hypothetical protein